MGASGAAGIVARAMGAAVRARQDSGPSRWAALPGAPDHTCNVEGLEAGGPLPPGSLGGGDVDAPMRRQRRFRPRSKTRQCKDARRPGYHP